MKDVIEEIEKLWQDITKTQERMCELDKLVKKEAMVLLEEVKEYDQLEHFNILEYSYINECTIYYEGEIYDGRDFYNQDLYNTVEYELPLELLYDQEARNTYITNLKKQAEEKKEQEQKEQERIKSEKKDQDYKTYLKLKQEFEGD